MITLLVRLEPEVLDEIRVAATDKGVTLSEFLIYAAMEKAQTIKEGN